MATNNGVDNRVVSGNFNILAGNLAIPTTTSALGQITMNGVRILHAYGPGFTDNFFAGIAAGNFTTTAQYCTGVGAASLASITGGNNNSCFGNRSGNAIANASDNSIFGYAAGEKIVSGSDNAIFGKSAYANGLGSYNVVVGHEALLNAAGAANYNVIIGQGAASLYTTTESSNIVIGHSVAGVAGESNKLRIGSGSGAGSGQLNKAWIHGIYGITPGGATTASVIQDSTGQLGTVARTASTAWTPVLAFGGTGGSSYTTQTGRYVLVDGVVTFTLNIVLSAVGAETGNATITGLPVAAGHLTALSVDYCELDIQDIQLTATVTGSTISLFAPVAEAARAPVTHGSFEDTTDLVISGSYIV